MDYILQNGDDFEKASWTLFLKDKFPNYNLFLEKYIHPVTEGTDNQMNFCMLHYSIMRNFNYIYLQIDKLSEEKDIELFKNIILRLGSIIDLTNEFTFHFLIENNKLTIKEVKTYCDSVKEKKLTEPIDYVSSYNNAEGISLNLFNKERIIKHFCKQTEKNFSFRNEFEILVNIYLPIRKFRNILVHSYYLTITSDNRYPPVDCLNRFYIRNTLKFKKERNKNSDFGNTELKTFQNPKDIIDSLCNPLIEQINVFWGKLDGIAKTT